jgi:hypothetical protein
VFFEKKVRKEALLWAHQDSIRVADSLKKIKIESKGVKKIQQTPLGKYDKEENPISARDTRDTYYIIAGSFTNHENAKLADRKYRNLGYKTSIISMTDQNGIETELVSVNTFNNINEAEEYLKIFKVKSNPAAWIYSKK